MTLVIKRKRLFPTSNTTQLPTTSADPKVCFSAPKWCQSALLASLYHAAKSRFAISESCLRLRQNSLIGRREIMRTVQIFLPATGRSRSFKLWRVAWFRTAIEERRYQHDIAICDKGKIPRAMVEKNSLLWV